MEAAEARVGDRAYIWCPSGHRVVGAPKEQLAISRTPCRSYRCSVCGPWQIDALRAAAWAVIGVLVGDRYGLTIHTATGNRRLNEALQRWHKGSPSNRYYLSIATTPRTLRILIAWRDDEPGHLPTRGIRRQILTLDDGIHGNAEWHDGNDALAEAADAMVAAVDRHAWADAVSDPFDPIRRATVLRGDRDLVGQISRVRDHLLGRTRPGAERTGSKWTPTTRCTDDIVSEVGARARHATKHLPFEALALAASGRPERMPMTAWIRGLRYARVVEPAPKVVSTITDAEGEHEVIDDGHDHRRRSLTRRFDLDDAGGIRIVDIHASMLADDYYSPSVLKIDGHGFVDLSLGSNPAKASLAGGGGGDG